MSLKAFRAVTRDLVDADQKTVFKTCWNLAGAVIDLNVRRMDETGENLLAAELRDAFISVFEAGAVGRAKIQAASIPHLDGFTVDVTDPASVKRSMRLLSGRLTGQINWEISGRKRRWEEPDKAHVPYVYPLGPMKSRAEIAALYRSKRGDVWRMMLAAWQIGQVSAGLDGTVPHLLKTDTSKKGEQYGT